PGTNPIGRTHTASGTRHHFRVAGYSQVAPPRESAVCSSTPPKTSKRGTDLAILRGAGLVAVRAARQAGLPGAGRGSPPGTAISIWGGCAVGSSSRLGKNRWWDTQKRVRTKADELAGRRSQPDTPALSGNAARRP